MYSPHRSCLALLALMSVALLAPRPAAADHDTYTITDLGTLRGKANSWSFWRNVNNKGVVAGYANYNPPNPNAFAADASFLWDRGTITPLLGLPGATDTLAAALNDNNLVVGMSGLDGFQSVHAVSWEKGKVTDLGTYGSDPYSKALGVNNRGQIVGLSYIEDTGFFGEHAVLWEKGQIHSLPPLPGSDEGPHHVATDINEKGHIVGHSGDYAVLWENRHSAPTALAYLANSFAVNDTTQVVGNIWNDTSFTQMRAFLWEKGALTVLDSVHPADPGAIAYDINNRGQIVGQSFDDFIFLDSQRAVLWEKKVPIDLNTRIPFGSGWNLLAACGINENGEIAGFGVHNGQYRAFLLTPRRK